MKEFSAKAGKKRIRRRRWGLLALLMLGMAAGCLLSWSARATEAKTAGLTGMQGYPSDSSLLENTHYYQKYLFTGFTDTTTTVTVGFYDGISELFVKIE